MIRGKKSFIIAIIFIIVAVAQILDRNFLAVFPFICGIYFFFHSIKGNE